MVIYGVNPVLEALRSGRVEALVVGHRRQGRLDELLHLAERRGVRVRRAEADELNRLASGGVHQGVVATIRPPEPRSVGDLVDAAAPALIVVLDGIEDPHNLGAIARTAEVAGASGLVVPRRRAAPLTGAAVKASAGALAHLPVAPVVNVARALAELQSAGVWTVGLDAARPRRRSTTSTCACRWRWWSAARAAGSGTWSGNVATGSPPFPSAGRWPA